MKSDDPIGDFCCFYQIPITKKRLVPISVKNENGDWVKKEMWIKDNTLAKIEILTALDSKKDSIQSQLTRIHEMIYYSL